MRLSTWFSLVLGTMLAMPACQTLAASPDTPSFDPARMWECTQADGSSIYTNKERAGCTLMTLKELSVVPSLDQMPTYRPTHEDMAAYGRAAGELSQVTSGTYPIGPETGMRPSHRPVPSKRRFAPLWRVAEFEPEIPRRILFWV